MVLRQVISNIIRYLLIFQIIVIVQYLMGDEVVKLDEELCYNVTSKSNNIDEPILDIKENVNVKQTVINSHFYQEFIPFYESYWLSSFYDKTYKKSISITRVIGLNWVWDILSNAAKFPFISTNRFQSELMKSIKYDAVCPIIIFSPKVIIKQDGIDITNTNHDEIVGRKINLTVQVLPEDLNIKNIHWTIPGIRVKSYTYTKQKSTLTKLGPVDLNNSSVSYYWVSGGEQKVECTVDINGKKYKGISVFNVKRPTAIMVSMTGKVSINSCLNSLLLSYETPTCHGFDIISNAVVPDGFTGSFQFLQIADKWLRRIRLNNGNWYRHSGTKLFDTVASYPFYDDSPGMELLSTFNKAEVSDSFESYLMFKPGGKTSIWVSLVVIKNLSWSAKSTKTSTGIWSLDSCKNNYNPRCSYTTDFPEWNGNILNLQWVKE